MIWKGLTNQELGRRMTNMIMRGIPPMGSPMEPSGDQTRMEKVGRLQGLVRPIDPILTMGKAGSVPRKVAKVKQVPFNQ